MIDVEAAELHGNAEWLAGIDMAELIKLTSSATVAQMLERDDFRDRYQAGRPISVVEPSTRSCRATTPWPSAPTSRWAAPIRSSTS